MSDFTDAYVDLLIKQYWEQANARAEIALQAGTWETIRDVISAFQTEFDLDMATGDRLDKIGALVGFARSLPYVIPLPFFGFIENPRSGGFDDLFNPDATLPGFWDLFEQPYSTKTFTDDEYRAMIQAKIVRNAASCSMVAPDSYTMALQTPVQTLFGNAAYAEDTQTMLLVLYIESDYDLDDLAVVMASELLPRPQGVRYLVVGISFFESFGFDNNADSLGFGDLFDVGVVGGKLAGILNYG